MITIQMKLKDSIEKIMIPESKSFLNELDEMIKNNSSSEDDLEAKKDMEYFLEELQTILKSIDNNQINDKEAEEIYEKINFMLEMHEAEHLDN
ncbi:DNA repair protein Rad50 [Aliarcobacter butzleri]|uniref:DNA repair protein Rad50 n=1 Tax=Aliarcobacter butzleri TaxID=28197 RepID=UPI0012F72629|nr:DNA repair protein Rad50 [Aliarcobacter butzleri]